MLEFEIDREQGSDELKWVWKFNDEDGNVLAMGKESFLDQDLIIESVKKVRFGVTQNAKIVAEKDADGLHDDCIFVIFKSGKDNRWCWKLLDDKKNILAVGCKDFDTKEAIEAFLDIIKGKICSNPTIRWTNIEDDPTHKSDEDEDKSGNPTTGRRGS